MIIDKFKGMEGLTSQERKWIYVSKGTAYSN